MSEPVDRLNELTARHCRVILAMCGTRKAQTINGHFAPDTIDLGNCFVQVYMHGIEYPDGEFLTETTIRAHYAEKQARFYAWLDNTGIEDTFDQMVRLTL